MNVDCGLVWYFHGKFSKDLMFYILPITFKDLLNVIVPEISRAIHILYLTYNEPFHKTFVPKFYGDIRTQKSKPLLKVNIKFFMLLGKNTKIDTK